MYSAESKQLFDRRGHAALQQHRLLHFAESAQQVIVLHIARAHLQDINHGQNHGNLRRVHHFAANEQSVLVGGVAHQFERLFTHALEAIRR